MEYVTYLVTAVAPIMAWLAGPWGVVAVGAFVILGAAAGVPVGSPIPALEGIALAACCRWAPAVADQVAVMAQGWLALGLLAWVASFTAMCGWLFANKWCEWRWFSFIEVPRLLMQRKSDS